jgi:hypothetical protein
MADSAEQSRSSVTKSDVYQILTSLVMHSEEVRWSRLNAFLVISSLFVAAWVGVLAGTDPFPDKKILLFLLCVPGALLGVLWFRLGWRSSEYMDDFHDKAFEVESKFPHEMPKPFHISEKRRENVRKGTEKFTSSKWLVATIPRIFSLLFIGLAFLSYRLDP